jgi:hypothetical protein
MKSKPHRITIIVDRGMVTDVYATTPLRVKIIDCDIDDEKQERDRKRLVRAVKNTQFQVL